MSYELLNTLRKDVRTRKLLKLVVLGFLIVLLTLVYSAPDIGSAAHLSSPEHPSSIENLQIQQPSLVLKNSFKPGSNSTGAVASSPPVLPLKATKLASGGGVVRNSSRIVPANPGTVVVYGWFYFCDQDGAN